MDKKSLSFYKSKHRNNSKLKVSSRTKLIFQTAVGVQEKFGYNSNIETVTSKRDLKLQNKDQVFVDYTQKPESPLPFDPDSKEMQELLQLKDILSDSDEDIFDYHCRSRCFVEHIREDSSSCVNITDNSSGTLQPIADSVDNGPTHTLNQTESLNLNEVTEELPLNECHSSAFSSNIISCEPQFSSIDRLGNETPQPSPINSNHLENACTSLFCPCQDQPPPCRSPDISDSVVSTPQANNSPFTCSTNPSTPASTHRRKSTIKKNKGKIRGRHCEEWIDNKRKALRNLGKEYKNRKGRLTLAKNLGAKCPPSCRMKCFSKISDQQRKIIFESFWNLGDRSKQWAYIAQLAIRQIKRRFLNDTQSRRKYTIHYKLPVGSSDSSEGLLHVNVCKKMFLGTFSVSEQFVKVAINKLDQMTGIVVGDQRGKHTKHRKVITDDIKDSVCAHIRQLKPVESHYIRKDSSKVYLDGGLTYRRLFDLYVEWVDTRSYTSRALTERQYHDIVNQNFNIAFHVPKKDQCDQCHTFKNFDIPSISDINKQDLHIANKTLSRQLKSQDKQEAKASDGKIIIASFDFQKILNAPHGEISVLYYKRKLSVFNFTVFSLGEKEGKCFMWHEGQAKRGANEVTSCLLNYIRNKIQKGALEFRFWSDNCVGQNRNRIVYIFYVYAVQTYNVKISHTFLEKGHTQAESDSVHALIEREAKNKLIYTPSEWYSLVRWAKKDGNPYDVLELDYTDFYNFKSLLQGRNWLKNLRGDKVEWNKIKQVEVNPEDPFKINYKYNLNDEFSTVSIPMNNTRSKKKAAPLSLSPLYPGPLPIAKPKMDDLMSLCGSGIIPKSYAVFFNSLLVADADTIMSEDESD